MIENEKQNEKQIITTKTNEKEKKRKEKKRKEKKRD